MSRFGADKTSERVCHLIKMIKMIEMMIMSMISYVISFAPPHPGPRNKTDDEASNGKRGFDQDSKKCPVGGSHVFKGEAEGCHEGSHVPEPRDEPLLEIGFGLV